MPDTLSEVQWFRIEDLAHIFERHLRPRVRLHLILDELQLGWYKWSRERQGVEGFRTGQKLVERPLADQLPSIDERVTRDFILRFAQEQKWSIPPILIGKQADIRREVGRPSKRTKEIISEFQRRAGANTVEATVTKEANALHAWASKQFPGEKIASVPTIYNNIRSLYREL